MVNLNLTQKILEENVRIHVVEAKIYEQIHSEIYNGYEQKALWRHINLINSLTNKESPCQALDIGCGTGNILFKLTSLGIKVTGVDISEQMLAILSQKDPSIKFFCTDVDNFLATYQGTKFDIITFSAVLHHLPNYLDTLSRAARLLTPKGVIFITHEPIRLNQSPNFLLLKAQMAVCWLAALAHQVRLYLAGVKWHNLDYTFSDFHSAEGIQVQALLDMLTREQFNVVKLEYYVAEKTAWGAFINNDFLHRSPNNFSLIAQKVG